VADAVGKRTLLNPVITSKPAISRRANAFFNETPGLNMTSELAIVF
jgi:GTPase Era involved in 16S rRNA processing